MPDVARILVAACCLIAGVSATAQDGPLLERLGLEAHGFVDGRGGVRTRQDPNEGDTSLAELRLQLDLGWTGDLVTVQVRADVLYDDAAGEKNPDLERGAGPIDLREANVLFSPLTFMDVKIGRQILTWGTGDLIFVNDLFPKDWQSFFLGRDDEYLKAPSDAIFVSLFPEFANIDIAYTPRFDADRFVRGERLSYWSPALGDVAGRNAIVDPEERDEWFEDDEVALRLSRDLGRHELALYGYAGYWKGPEGFDPAAGKAIFPRLAAYGASLQGPLASGLFSLEAGRYDSRDDRSGDEPFTPNSEWRFVAGHEHEIARDLAARFQYYLEYMDDYDEYEDGLPATGNARPKDRHTATLRLTTRMLNQNLTLSLFCRYSPSDHDAYLRPVVKYKLTDAWLLTAGANVFAGRRDHTFLGQFEKNSNIYIGARYSF